ncbi:hypothetical protein NEIPOLOT_02068 [Neisseria polysaccharea ATCC 43768]|nr:hypothetical protein NEIPOLOT_02068 [Neisseria polysaccharea ATCC 43768]
MPFVVVVFVIFITTARFDPIIVFGAVFKAVRHYPYLAKWVYRYFFAFPPKYLTAHSLQGKKWKFNDIDTGMGGCRLKGVRTVSDRKRKKPRFLPFVFEVGF